MSENEGQPEKGYMCAVLTADFPATALLNFPAIALLGSCGNLRSTNTSFETPSFIYRLIANVIRPIAQKRVNFSMNFNIVQILSDYVEFYVIFIPIDAVWSSYSTHSLVKLL